MSADGARLCSLYRQAGITHGICFSIEACHGSLDLGNSYTLREVEKQPMLSALLVVHPYHLESSLRWIEEAAAHPQVVGIKLHPALGDFNILAPELFDLIGGHIAPAGLPILSHVSNSDSMVTVGPYLQMASMFPNVRFIAAHLGIGILGPGDAAARAWTQTRPSNVWFDMATLRAFTNGAVENLLRAVGPERLCFGTDAPLYVPAPFTRLLETLPIDEETRCRIAWRNALAVFPKLAGREGVPQQ
jgi:predicted TIM-barrel fold metal-dependent hydrolase